MSDRERPLNNRGQRDAPRMARLLDEQQLTPDLILCSTAERARETTQLIVEHCVREIEVRHTKRLYLAAPKECASAVRDNADAESCVMIVAHNPGLENLVTSLSGEYERMSTAALARFEVDIESWKEFSLDTSCRLVHVYRPKEL